jgi:hypothetical protein
MSGLTFRSAGTVISQSTTDVLIGTEEGYPAMARAVLTRSRPARADVFHEEGPRVDRGDRAQGGSASGDHAIGKGELHAHARAAA